MYRIFTAVAVFILSVIIGIRHSNTLKLRVDTLRSMMDSINRLSMRMDYTMAPILELIEYSKNENTAAFFDMFIEKVRELNDIGLAWKEAMEFAQSSNSGFSALKDEELDAFNEYAVNLGNNDYENQLKNINILKLKLDEILTEASDIYKKKGQLSRRMGILCGIAFALLLL